MRNVGKRAEPALLVQPDGASLASGILFNTGLAQLAEGGTFFPKGVFRYKSHAEANQHKADCLASGMAALAMKRRHG